MRPCSVSEVEVRLRGGHHFFILDLGAHSPGGHVSYSDSAAADARNHQHGKNLPALHECETLQTRFVSSFSTSNFPS